MKTQTIGVILNGVTGRMGRNQHLVRSILAIRKQGGVKLASGDVLVPEPLLVGRDADKLTELANAHGLKHTSTDLDVCLGDPNYPVYFDAVRTDLRVENVRKALAAGKAVYCEKPVAHTLEAALDLAQEAERAGLKNGVVQDKLWLPGMVKLRKLLDSGFFGRVYAVRGEFGYWVFDGREQPAQRPSWNYRKEDGGSLILDMFPHWRYLIDTLFGNVTAVSCHAATHVPTRLDETGQEYACTADDAAYATFLTETGVVCQFNSSWAVRVRRDDLLVLQVDGERGSAVAGLRRCYVQPASETPRFVWNPDEDQPHDFRADWHEFEPDLPCDNAFKAQWERFLNHVAGDEPFPWTFREGAKGVQLAEAALTSWRQQRWVELPAID